MPPVDPHPPVTLASGEQLGPWRIDWCLGRGAMGVAYRCHMADDPTPRVLKVVTGGLGPRFRAELDALRRLEHPAIVRLIDTGAERGEPWLVMELARGRPLSALITTAPLPEELAAGIVQRLADALAHAHERGVCHRDVRPSNVLVDGDGLATLVDFGIAEAGRRLTRTGSRSPGTPRYAPPEWFTGPLQDGAAADVYALGVVAWELLEGRPALYDVPLAELADAKRRPLEASRGPGILRSLTRTMTSVEAGDRPSARAVAQALASSAPRVARRAPPTAPTLPSDPGAHPEHIGRYRVRGELGRGGMGVVLDAWDPEARRAVAVKWLPPLPGDTRRHEARFRREVDTLGRLDHPGIVRILDVGQHEGRLFYAMERVDGPDLATLLRERGLVSPTQAITWGLQVAEALQRTHEAGIVHRDVKPSNILLTGGERARLADFGLALPLDESRLTEHGGTVGTPAYMAPEQARGGPLGPAVDQFALGVVLYEALTGRLPADGEHALAVAARHAQGVTRADQVTPGVPRELGRLVARCMAPQVADRYPDLTALIADLRAVRDGGSARRDDLGRLARQVRRRAGTLLSIAAVVIALGASTIAGAVLMAPSWREGARERAAEERLQALSRTLASRRAAGEAHAALAAFDGFVTFEENLETRAVAQAWLLRAAWAAEEQDAAAVDEALAHAWLQARHVDDEVAVLRQLAPKLVDDQQWDAASAVLEALEARGFVDVDALRDAVSLADRRLDEVDDPALVPLIAPLSAAHPLPGTTSVSLCGEVDLDGDGQDDLLALHDLRPARLPRGDPSLTRIAPLDLGVDRVGAFILVDGRFLVTHADGRIGVFELGLGPPVLRARWEDAMPGGAALFDLDDDGVQELLIGTRWPTRHLVALVPSELDRWTPRPLPDAWTARSATEGLWAGDFDGDGTAELAHVRTAFGGYDARLLGPGPRVLGRLRVGDQRASTRLRAAGRDRLLVSRYDMWPSDQVFPADAPFGPLPAGMHLLDWDGTRLSATAHLDARPTPEHPVAVDVDGDGVDELMAISGAGLILARQLADGSLRHVVLDDLGYNGAADVDGDGDDELAVFERSTGRRWLLGLGRERLPPVRRQVPVLSTLSDPPMRRAEDLAALGLRRQAARHLAKLAEQSPPSQAAHMHARAAELHEALARLPEAVAERLRAVRHGDAASRVDAVRLQRTLLLWREARDLAAEGLSAPDLDQDVRLALRAELARLDALFAEPPVDLDLSLDLYGFRVSDPLHAWHDPGRGTLELLAVGDGELARVPLTLSGGPLLLELDLATRRLEWGSNLEFHLEAAGGTPEGPPTVLRLSGMGGGGRTQVQASCTAPDGTLGKETIPVDGPDLVADVRLRLGLDPAAGPARCVVDGLPRPVVESIGAVPIPSGRWDLVIRARSLEGASLASAGLRRVIVHGATLEPPPSGAREQLAGQDPERALAGLAALRDPDVELLRMHALDELGRAAEADGAFARWVRVVGPEALESRGPALLRARSPSLRDRLARALGPRWPIVWRRAWEVVWQAHPDDAVWMAALTGPPQALDDPGVGAPEVRAAVQGLLLARGRAFRISGSTARAAADLRRAVALAEAGSGDAFDARRDLAAVLASRGDSDGAFDLLSRAIRGTDARDVHADQLLVAEELAALHGDPRWQAIEAASAGVGALTAARSTGPPGSPPRPDPLPR